METLIAWLCYWRNRPFVDGSRWLAVDFAIAQAFEDTFVILEIR